MLLLPLLSLPVPVHRSAFWQSQEQSPILLHISLKAQNPPQKPDHHSLYNIHLMTILYSFYINHLSDFCRFCQFIISSPLLSKQAVVTYWESSNFLRILSICLSILRMDLEHLRNSSSHSEIFLLLVLYTK